MVSQMSSLDHDFKVGVPATLMSMSMSSTTSSSMSLSRGGVTTESGTGRDGTHLVLPAVAMIAVVSGFFVVVCPGSLGGCCFRSVWRCKGVLGVVIGRSLSMGSGAGGRWQSPLAVGFGAFRSRCQ